MIDPLQFRLLVIRPALVRLGLWSLAAERLLLGTALVESRLTYLKQKPGPALGLYQMEPATHFDIWKTYLAYRPGLALKVKGLAVGLPRAEQMVWNLFYATAMARLKYRRDRHALPGEHDLVGLGAYYKRVFNTYEGQGSAASFEERLRPFWGKPILTLDHLPYS